VKTDALNFSWPLNRQLYWHSKLMIVHS
jgi:hypothetical protein